MSAAAAHVTLADLLDERAEQLRAVARRLRAFQPSDTLPPHRILALSGQLLAQLADLERSAHDLTAWLPAAPIAEPRASCT